jgi:N-acetylglucosamine-6-phosphate deacetylase
LKIYLTAAQAFTPLETIDHPVLLIDDGKIQQISSRENIAIPPGSRHRDFPGAILAPGFVDIHVHGGGGHDVMEGDETALNKIELHLARTGVTSYLPTTVTASINETLQALEKLAISITQGRRGQQRAHPLGVHLEGPFISKTKCGVHPLEHIRAAEPALFDRLVDAADGKVRMMTLAPEISGAEQLIRHARAAGIRVSLGHSDASAALTNAAISAGATHATHTFNAMRALDHREPGIAGIVLSSDVLSADIIADGIHVAPEIVKIFLQAKTKDRAVLITDAISATGIGDGTYRLGTFEVRVSGNRCEVNGKLAGSVLTLDRAVRNVMKFAGWSLQQAVQLATFNAAMAAGLEETKGLLANGKDADIVVLSPTGHILTTIIAGHVAG